MITKQEKSGYRFVKFEIPWKFIKKSRRQGCKVKTMRRNKFIQKCFGFFSQNWGKNQNFDFFCCNLIWWESFTYAEKVNSKGQKLTDIAFPYAPPKAKWRTTPGWKNNIVGSQLNSLQICSNFFCSQLVEKLRIRCVRQGFYFKFS